MRSLLLVAALAACGGDDGGAPAPDAFVKLDAGVTATVMEVSCTGVTANATVTTTDLVDKYSPMSTTITVGQVVKFTTSANHDVKPNPIAPKTDPGLSVGFNKTTCLKFTATGAYGFLCSIHGFVGTITVN
ncbi:hypothetical protein BH11MYX3_BH11MYX3_14860 [soil metagenome]